MPRDKGKHDMKREASKYDGVMIMLHWVIGIGIILLAGTELFRHEFPKGHFIREGLKFIHQPAGTVLFALILVRLAWRMTLAKVPSALHPAGFGELSAKIVHSALYGLMVAIPLLGLLYVFGSDKTIDFGAFQLVLPLKSSIGTMAKSMRDLHETLGVGILLMALVHALAALGHHYVLKDGLLSRMQFRQPRSLVIEAAE